MKDLSFAQQVASRRTFAIIWVEDGNHFFTFSLSNLSWSDFG